MARGHAPLPVRRKAKRSRIWPTGTQHCLRRSTQATNFQLWPLVNIFLFHVFLKSKLFSLKYSAAFKNKKSLRRNLWFLFNTFTAHKILLTWDSVVEKESPISLIAKAVTYGLWPTWTERGLSSEAEGTQKGNKHRMYKNHDNTSVKFWDDTKAMR